MSMQTMHIGPLPRKRRRPHGFLLLIGVSTLAMWIIMGMNGVIFNLGICAMLFILSKICVALRTQPSGPPARTEQFDVTNVGNQKFTISSEDGKRDYFLAALGSGPRATATSTIISGCRFRLVPFGSVPTMSSAAKVADEKDPAKQTMNCLEELPWTESAVQVVSIEVADGPKAGEKLFVNPAGRARWFKNRVSSFREEFTLTKVGANFTIKTHGRLLDAKALLRSRAWKPNYTAALAMFLTWVLAAKNCVLDIFSFKWVQKIRRISS
mmetsp:Transcript_195/g.524  ORF Transcript_195/g.524 Transcript_195/m.524 type:complete len:268 (+) Transcript_195:160-963(+)